MRGLEPNKVFMIQVFVPELAAPVNELAAGKYLESAVSDIKNRYPGFKRIIIYDADTKDAVRIIRNTQ